MLPFEDCSSRLASSEVVLENLKGIAPAMEYIIDRHERAFKAAEQQRDLHSGLLSLCAFPFRKPREDGAVAFL